MNGVDGKQLCRIVAPYTHIVIKDREHRSQQEGRNHPRERDWNRPRFPSRSGTPETRHRHSQEFHRRLSHEFRSPSHSKSLSHESAMSQGSVARPGHKYLERRGSFASLRSLDDDHGSRPSSVGSQADCQFFFSFYLIFIVPENLTRSRSNLGA